MVILIPARACVTAILISPDWIPRTRSSSGLVIFTITSNFRALQNMILITLSEERPSVKYGICFIEGDSDIVQFKSTTGDVCDFQFEVAVNSTIAMSIEPDGIEREGPIWSDGRVVVNIFICLISPL